ncbi:hypothetical protein G7046_g3918 [Stylonectria norvegica]|nr:hypothetical protein G7046_g3918 [Stylonectria norvegica]
MVPSTTANSKGGMFHIFQGIAPRKPSAESPDAAKSGSSGGGKRITTPHACVECKRRKIRCDGQQPCGQCLSSRARKSCSYDKHRQRVVPSRKTLEALSQSVEEYRGVLKRLYPDCQISSLLPLSRQELLGLLNDQTVGSLAALPSPPLNSSPVRSEFESPSESGLANLDQTPVEHIEWDEERREREPIPMEADDVNALSLTMDRQTSYLGASSIKAALLVMLKVQPQLRSFLSSPLNGVEMAHNLPVIRQRTATPQDKTRIAWSWGDQTLIDAYFERVHVFVPMIDEASFRDDYLQGHRIDSPWISLLNMVFAMGSIVAMKSDDFSHIDYYNRSMEHLTIDSFGSSHIETVQALALIGGYYLHYINRPNMANAVVGASIRMASALGLHREPLVQADKNNTAVETRRRTWWSLLCLDTWATTTLGRPSFGRWGPGINLRIPEIGINQVHDSALHAGILPLIENIKFCKIATQVQDMLAVTPLLKADDRCSMDNQLLEWHSELPWLLRSTDPCAEPLYIARCVMKWRYQNLRMLLHRPVLLSMASAGTISGVAEKDLAAMELCRELAKVTIEDISREWARNQMSGWNAVWFLYQAVMIPLISIFWQWDSPSVSVWQKQIETVLELFEAMEDWSLAARRSREVVWRMYATSQQPLAASGNDCSASGAGDLPLSDGDLYTSSMGLDTDEMVNLLNQHGFWDLDENWLIELWSPRAGESATLSSVVPCANTTASSHIFCLECAHRLGVTGQETERCSTCPACNSQLTNPDDAVIANLNPSEDYKTSVLSGLSPNIIMECAGRALSFWAYQTTQDIYYQQYLYKTLTDKYTNLSIRLDKTVNDANSEIEGLQHKLNSLAAEHDALRRKNEEIAQAYREKGRKLLQTQELYDKVKRKAEMGHIQRAASDAVDSSLLQQDSNGFSSSFPDHQLPQSVHAPAFGQSNRLDMARMNAGLPRSSINSAADESRWARMGGPSRSAFSVCPQRYKRSQNLAIFGLLILLTQVTNSSSVRPLKIAPIMSLKSYKEGRYPDANEESPAPGGRSSRPFPSQGRECAEKTAKVFCKVNKLVTTAEKGIFRPPTKLRKAPKAPTGVLRDLYKTRRLANNKRLADDERLVNNERRAILKPILKTQTQGQGQLHHGSLVDSPVKLPPGGIFGPETDDEALDCYPTHHLWRGRSGPDDKRNFRNEDEEDAELELYQEGIFAVEDPCVICKQRRKKMSEKMRERRIREDGLINWKSKDLRSDRYEGAETQQLRNRVEALADSYRKDVDIWVGGDVPSKGDAVDVIRAAGSKMKYRYKWYEERDAELKVSFEASHWRFSAWMDDKLRNDMAETDDQMVDDGNKSKAQYGVILDAGSSGTRVYVYKWKNPAAAVNAASATELQNLPKLKLEKSKKLHPGVSSFADNVASVGPDHLQPLIDMALEEVPRDKISETPIYLMATAGMRLLPQQQQTALLQNICTYLRSATKFILPDCSAHIQVISGETEGLYGWIAANYLLGGFHHPEKHNHGKNHHTYGFLDMGGASAQIAFAPNVTESEKHANDLKLVRMRNIDGSATEHKVFTATWLGFGANKARQRFVENLQELYGKDTHELPDPCMPKGLRTTLEGEPIQGKQKLKDKDLALVGTGMFDECLRETYPLLGKDTPCQDHPCLLNGQHVPAIDFDVNHFVGVSEYWHTTHGVFGKKHKAYDLATYQNNVMEFCSRDWSQIVQDLDKRKKTPEHKAADAREACFKASWLINMLYDGIGIPRIGLEGGDAPSVNGTKDASDKGKEDVDPFKPIDKVDGIELSWTLGKMVLYAAGQVPPQGAPLPVGFGSNVASGKPDDFEPAGSVPLPSSSAGDDDDLDDLLKTPSGSTSSWIAAVIVLLLIGYLLRKPERRRKLFSLAHRRRRSGSSRKPGRGFSLTDKLFGRGSASYDRVMEEGEAAEFELGELDSDDNEHSDTSDSSRAGRASGLATPTLNLERFDEVRPPPPSAMDRAGLVVRTESRERLAPTLQMLNAGRRSRNGSPTRAKSPFMTPLQED